MTDNVHGESKIAPVHFTVVSTLFGAEYIEIICKTHLYVAALSWEN